MPVAAPPGVSWIDEICRRTSAALGWSFEFHSEPCPGSDGTWQAEVHDGHEAIGTLRLRPGLRRDDEADVRTALATAGLVADLVNRLSKANRKLDAQRRDVHTLVELGRALPADATVSGSLQRLLKAAVQLTGYWASAFFLVDARRAELRLRASHGIERELIPSNQRALAQSSPDRAALLQNFSIVASGEPGHQQWLPSTSSVGVCVPVNTPEGPLGSLWCYDRRQRAATDREIHVLQSVAAQIAAALERTVLLRESAARKKLREELQAASVHHPGSAVCALPRDSRLDVAFRSASAAELGGDLCEVWPLGEQRTLIAVGDAVGHSVPAALIMAIARGSLRTLLHEGAERVSRTELLMRRINQTLCTVTRAEQFMSMVCAAIDLNAMTMTYTNAGHPPPWLSRDGRRSPLDSHGLLLGVLPETGYQHSVLPLRRGDLLLFFTDGVSEALSRDRSFFRTEGVLSALGNDPHQTAAKAADAIWRQLHEHLGLQAPADDQTLLVVKVR